MSILDNVKDVAKLAQEVGKLELYQKAVDLMMQVTELAQQNYSLQNELERLRRENTITSTLHFGVNSYWQLTEGKWIGPFCSRCWDVEKQLVRLTIDKRFQPCCPSCKNYAPNCQSPTML